MAELKRKWAQERQRRHENVRQLREEISVTDDTAKENKEELQKELDKTRNELEKEREKRRFLELRVERLERIITSRNLQFAKGKENILPGDLRKRKRGRLPKRGQLEEGVPGPSGMGGKGPHPEKKKKRKSLSLTPLVTTEGSTSSSS